jgi:alkylated DNA repair protein (DNA oxidative demethylase)
MPEACLVNWYEPGAKLGLHVDRDEEEFSAPVVSISLGDDAWFRVGGLKRRDPTERILLKSGDVVVMGGEARLIHHGIDRIVPGTSDLLAVSGRYNLTLRRVTAVVGG